jgi:hypothetical protein
MVKREVSCLQVFGLFAIGSSIAFAAPLSTKSISLEVNEALAGAWPKSLAEGDFPDFRLFLS